MTATGTPEDVVKAAASIARDAAAGRLEVSALDAKLEAACRDLAGTVVGPADPLWALQVDIARQVLSHGGVPTTELAEWLAVQRRRENPNADQDGQGATEATGGAEAADGADALAEASSEASEAHSAENNSTPDDAAAVAADAAAQLVNVLAPLAAEPKPEPAAEPADTGCGCAAHTAKRGPKFNGTVLARGRGLPGQ